MAGLLKKPLIAFSDQFRRSIFRTLLLIPTAVSAATNIASQTLLLDGTLAGPEIVAVGERGTILRSSDNGISWSPAIAVPTLATLTGVTFADARHGWAVGHDAIILATTDGGENWVKSWQGNNLADSFLDVIALDDSRVIAVGAYGLFVVSDDGGRSWNRRKIIDEDYHLNRISCGTAGELYIAGEHGTILRSKDSGKSWKLIATPYDGSFYGVISPRPGTLLAYGLRGKVYRSNDEGETWTFVPTGETELLATAVRPRHDVVVLAGQVRALLVSTDCGQTFMRRDVGVTDGIAELIVLPSGSLLALGEGGAWRIDPDRLAAAESKP